MRGGEARKYDMDKSWSYRNSSARRSAIHQGIYRMEMLMARTAKLFRNGRSQAVRLPIGLLRYIRVFAS
jgi:hypothetical protein